MVEKIKHIKDQLLHCMEQKINERGIERADMKELGEIADAVKDLAEAEKACWEAEYYMGISEAMDKQGYMPDGGTMGVYSGSMGNSTRQGYRDRMGRYASRSGYGSVYHDDIQSIREAMTTATPEERERMQRELRQLISM